VFRTDNTEGTREVIERNQLRYICEKDLQDLA